ncbi:MAG: FtsW/RodA/SpoVE family cell cycle protein [Planctomycetota bacterium]|nr:FtsW/RodA/SpoVE family cell cycle protein [Planctomycetota bacterium]MDP6956816.1 FtsW/RodA/SpoVE family cell cycle protein [Planctomycetota bacterium]
MARFWRKPDPALGQAVPAEHQGSIFDVPLGAVARTAEVEDARRPAAKVFYIVLALLGLGFLVQASHAATTLSVPAFRSELLELLIMRMAGIAIMLGAMRLGPRGVRRFIPALFLLSVLALVAVYLPLLSHPVNGSRRWIMVPGLGLTLQPSEFARVAAVLWVADRCRRLGPRIREMRNGYLPLLLVGLGLFLLVGLETDLGGAFLLFVCFLATMWVGGADRAHLGWSMATIGGGGFILGYSAIAYVRDRVAVWMGEVGNSQVIHTGFAMASGDWFGTGLGQGLWRNRAVPYLQTDYVFALVGEELGLVGMFVALGLIGALAWFSLRLVLSVRDEFSALVAFGLLTSVLFQTLIHLSVVTGLAPPKGMTLPFVSDGGTALLSSCFAMGLALGAAREAATASSVGRSSAALAPSP